MYIIVLIVIHSESIVCLLLSFIASFLDQVLVSKIRSAVGPHPAAVDGTRDARGNTTNNNTRLIATWWKDLQESTKLEDCLLKMSSSKLCQYATTTIVMMLMLLSAALADWKDWFNPGISRARPSFKGNQLYPVNVGLDDVTGFVGCFGDFNSDK